MLMSGVVLKPKNKLKYIEYLLKKILGQLLNFHLMKQKKAKLEELAQKT